MIPEIILDTEEFSDIFEEARGKIASIYPEWTDYNYHDPGITMLELFAWLKEGQQFYMDQTGEAQKEKFLKLLGTRRLVKEPAKALLTMETDKNIILPKGTKFYADTICYESVEQNVILKEDITTCFYVREKVEEYLDRKQLNFGNQLRIHMFGKEPEPGDTFYIGLTKALPINMEISIYFDLFTEYEVIRNPLTQKLAVPFVKFCMEYFTKDGWRKVSHLKDTTYGFLQDGQIFFEVKNTMKPGNVFGEEGYFLRIRLKEGVYDIPPVLAGFGINVLRVVQTEHFIEHCVIPKNSRAISENSQGMVCVKDTTFLALYGENDVYAASHGRLHEVSVVQKYLDTEHAECTFVFEVPEEWNKFEEIHLIHRESAQSQKKMFTEGNGYPNQSYELLDELVEYESFELMVQDELGDFILWEKVQDFSESGPEDRHYVFDSRTGTVTFGNSIRGLAPEGEIRIISYARSLGSDGKVKAGRINQISREIESDAVVTNNKDSWGGRKEETLEESFVRVQKELKCPVTAVTYEDYERYIRETPGLMIANCKVLKPMEVTEIFPYYDESAITVVVKPFAKQIKKELMAVYRRNILSYLELFRMTGTSVYLIRPEYIAFELYVEVVIKTHYIHAEEEIKETVERWFQALGKEFGGCVRYSKLYGVIDMLPCVKRLRSVSFEVKGTGVKHLPDGSVKVPPNGVVELKEAEYQFTMD